MSEVQCYNCRDTGHYSTSCPQKREIVKGKTQGFPGAKKPLPILLAPKAIASGKQIVTVIGFLNNVAITFVLDTGASSMILSRSIARKLHLKLLNGGLKIVTATDGVSADVHSREKVTIEVHGSVVHMPVIVHDLPAAYMCLLGLDWLQNAKCMIDTVDNRLIFKPREV